jgi:DNA-directed RNA polymerase I, II, and III subunit RPABC1
MLRDRGYDNIPDNIQSQMKDDEIYIKSNKNNIYIYNLNENTIKLTDIRSKLKKIYMNKKYYKENKKIDLDLHILIIKKNIQKIEENIFIKKIPFIQVENNTKSKGIFENENKIMDLIDISLDELKMKEPDIEYYDINNLMINITKHDILPKFEIYDTVEKKKEIIEMLDNINPKIFPKMLINDPIAKYYNLKIGDILKIKRTSPLSGETISFRIII